LTRRARRVIRGLVGGCGALLLGVTVSGCLAPQYTYVANSSLNVYFKVPNGWHKINDSALTSAMKAAIGGSPGSAAWLVAYQPGGKPAADDFLSFSTTQPFVFVDASPLSSTLSSDMSYNALRDSFLPVTSDARTETADEYQQEDKTAPYTNFKQISDQVLTEAQGVHGIKEVFSYTATGGHTDTFDQIALTNADQTVEYLLVLHCTNSCYSSNQKEINDVMSSFTVRSP